MNLDLGLGSAPTPSESTMEKVSALVGYLPISKKRDTIVDKLNQEF